MSAKASESGNDKRRGNSSGRVVLRNIERLRGESIVAAIKGPCFHCFFIRSNLSDFRHNFGGLFLLKNVCFLSHSHPLLRIFILLSMFLERFLLKLFTFFFLHFLTTPSIQMREFLMMSWLMSQCLLAAVFYTFFWLALPTVSAELCQARQRCCSPVQVFILPGQQGLRGFTWFWLFWSPSSWSPRAADSWITGRP